jgi:light-regulated signal transduction histidine kinase (bacteriophytochrome)
MATDLERCDPLLTVGTELGLGVAVVGKALGLLRANPVAAPDVAGNEGTAGRVLPVEEWTRTQLGGALVEPGRALDRVLTDGTSTHEEMVVPGGSGTPPRRIVVGAVPVAVDDGRGAAVVWRDVTGEHAAQQQILELTAANGVLELRAQERSLQMERQAGELEAARREVDVLAAGIGHDLRAPLRTMSGFARLLMEQHGLLLDDRGRHYADRILAGAQELGALLDGLLRLSRLQGAPLHREPLDMTALATSLSAEVIGGREHTVAVCELPAALGDPQLIHEVWAALLDNAVKFSGHVDRPEVRVDGWPDGAMSVYRVRDNGAGFDPALGDTLFAPFSRLHRQDEFPGSGMGLAMVKRIVERHGGRVWAACSPAEHTSLCFTLEATR